MLTGDAAQLLAIFCRLAVDFFPYWPEVWPEGIYLPYDGEDDHA